MTVSGPASLAEGYAPGSGNRHLSASVLSAAAEIAFLVLLTVFLRNHADPKGDGMEMVGGSIIDSSGATLAYALSTSVEEFLAMMGVLVAFGTLLGEARSAGPVILEVAEAEVMHEQSHAVTEVVIEPGPRLPSAAMVDSSPVRR